MGSRSGELLLKQYKPPGPVGLAYIQSLHPITFIMGPGGSGKTVASVYKPFYHAIAGHLPVCTDGKIRCRIAVVRDTYRDLRKTTLATWHEFFEKGCREQTLYEGGQDRPVRHIIEFDIAMKSGPGRMELVAFELDMQFGAIGDLDVEAFTKGYEITAAWGNEVDLMAPGVMDALYGRTGRYPPRADIAPSELDRMAKLHGIDEDGQPKVPRFTFADLNPPDISHWVIERCIENKKDWPNYRLFEQPSGLSDRAENRAGKTRGQYEDEAKSGDENWVRRYVHGKPGYLPNEKPIYPEFSMDRHVAKEHMDADEALPLLLGADAGGSPACLISQMMPTGQWRWLDEVVSEPGTGPERFANTLLERLAQRFPGCFIGEAYLDPAAFYGNDKETGEGSWASMVHAVLGFRFLPTETNDPAFRQDAVRYYLTNFIDGDTARLLVNPHMQIAIGGFAAHYKQTKRSSAGETDTLQVAKNHYSHLHDGGQYAALGHGGKQLIIDRAAKAARSPHANTRPAARSVIVKPKQSVFSV
jgi:hypothetical protein